MNNLEFGRTLYQGEIPGFSPKDHRVQDITTISSYLRDSVDNFEQKVEELESIANSFLSIRPQDGVTEQSIEQQKELIGRNFNRKLRELTESGDKEILTAWKALGRVAHQQDKDAVQELCKPLPTGRVPEWFDKNYDGDLKAEKSLEDNFYGLISSTLGIGKLAKFAESTNKLVEVRDRLLVNEDARRLTNVKSKKLDLYTDISLTANAAFLRNYQKNETAIDDTVRTRFLASSNPGYTETYSQIKDRTPIIIKGSHTFSTQDQAIIQSYKDRLKVLNTTINEDHRNIAEKFKYAHPYLTALRDNGMNPILDKVAYTLGKNKLDPANPDSIKPKLLDPNNMGTNIKELAYDFSDWLDDDFTGKVSRMGKTALRWAAISAVAVGVISGIAVVAAGGGSLIWGGITALAGSGTVVAGSGAAAQTVAGAAAGNTGILAAAGKAAFDAGAFALTNGLGGIWAATKFVGLGIAAVASNPFTATVAGLATLGFLATPEITTKMRQHLNAKEVKMKGARYELNRTGADYTYAMEQYSDHKIGLQESLYHDVQRNNPELMRVAMYELAKENPDMFTKGAEDCYKDLKNIHPSQPMRTLHNIMCLMRGSPEAMEITTELFDNDAMDRLLVSYGKDPKKHTIKDVNLSMTEVLNETRKFQRMAIEAADLSINDFNKTNDPSLNAYHLAGQVKSDMTLANAGFLPSIMKYNLSLERSENSFLKERGRYGHPVIRKILNYIQEALPFLKLGQDMHKNIISQDYLLNTVGIAYGKMNELAEKTLEEGNCSVAAMEQMDFWMEKLTDSLELMVSKMGGLHNHYLCNPVLREFFKGANVNTKMHAGHLCNAMLENIYGHRLENQERHVNGIKVNRNTALGTFFSQLDDKKYQNERVQKARSRIGANFLRGTSIVQKLATTEDGQEGFGKFFDKEQAELNWARSKGDKLNIAQRFNKWLCKRIYGFNPHNTSDMVVRITHPSTDANAERQTEDGLHPSIRDEIYYHQVVNFHRKRHADVDPNNAGARTNMELINEQVLNSKMFQTLKDFNGYYEPGLEVINDQGKGRVSDDAKRRLEENIYQDYRETSNKSSVKPDMVPIDKDGPAPKVEYNQLLRNRLAEQAQERLATISR